MPRLEFECQLSVPVDGYGIDDREPKPVIKLREGLSVLRQFEHKAANVLGLGFPLCLHRLELFQLGLGGFVPLRQTVVTFQIINAQESGTSNGISSSIQTSSEPRFS